MHECGRCLPGDGVSVVVVRQKPGTTATTPLRRIDPDEAPVDQIHEILLVAILSFELAPGVRVSEADIARAVGASRTPVRAALARLGDEGLIETRPSRGNYVTRLSAKAVRDAHFVRDALESATVAHLARGELSAPMAERLDANLTAAGRAAERGDDVAFGSLDDGFHHLLAEATGHARLVQLLVREKAGLARLRALCPADTAYMRCIVAEHEGILRAVEGGDEHAARARLSAHIGRVLATLEGLQEAHADFFEEDVR